MQLNDIRAMAEDQDRGHWYELADPVDGKPTGIRLRIAGPDSETQRAARLKLADDLADLADADGRVSPAAREQARLDNLARCILAWEIAEDGEPVPFTHRNIIRLLKAGAWVQAQVDAFAADRSAHRGNA